MSAELVIHVQDRAVAVVVGGARQQRALGASATSLAPEQLAEVIADVVSTLDVRRRDATLVIPAAWCYVHRVSAPQRRPGHAMLAYALEEYLPVDIEQLTCEFVRSKDRQFIGVAVETQRMRALLDACSGVDIRIERITLDVIHAAEHLPEAARLIWCDEEHFVVLARDGRVPVDLRVVRLASELSRQEWCRRVAAHLEAD